jgi:ACS family tartrate transporter-like MFS transporter
MALWRSSRHLPSVYTLDSGEAERVRRKIARRILPFLFFLYVIAYLDRANIAFARVPMSQELGFSDAVYGLGTGLFFVGYFFLEVPGALIVERWGARRWISRIMLTWGVVTVLFAFQRTPSQFYTLRFLLGAAEAGFFPGIIVYLTRWFRSDERSAALTAFVIAAPVSLVIGGPLSALILRIHWGFLTNWRWIFLLQGALAVGAGVLTLVHLTDTPMQAGWLNPVERQIIQNALDLEESKRPAHIWWHGLREPNVLLLCAAHAFANIAGYGFVFWLPSTIHATLGLTAATADAVSSLPFILAALAMPLMAASSNQSKKPKLYACIPMLCAAIFFSFTLVPGQPAAFVLIWLCLTGASAYAWIPGFWYLPTCLSAGRSRAASIGLINSIGNLGGFFGPTLIGFLQTKSKSNHPLVFLVSLSYCAAAILTARLNVKGLSADVGEGTS